MSTDICKSFRSAFAYGYNLKDDLSGQFTECCTSHLDKHPHIDNIDDMFNDLNFTQVAVPIMKCQREKVQGLKSRREQIKAVCETEENWEDMKKDPTLPKFVKDSKEGKDDFVGSCREVMKAKDMAKGTTGRRLEVTFEDAKADILKRIGENGAGADGSKGSIWKQNVDNIKLFCHDAGYGNWTGAEADCCVQWVKNNRTIKDVEPNPDDITKSFSQKLIDDNDGQTFSLDSQTNPNEESLHSQCGMHGWL